MSSNRLIGMSPMPTSLVSMARTASGTWRAITGVTTTALTAANAAAARAYGREAACTALPLRVRLLNRN